MIVFNSGQWSEEETQKVCTRPKKVSTLYNVTLTKVNMATKIHSSFFSSQTWLITQVDALHEHIDKLIGKKEDEEIARLNWKAIELLGDEDMAAQQRDLPPDHAHTPNSKALSKLGTVKAVESKKVRNRLGSDMSHDAVKRQQIAELREIKKKEEQQRKQSGANWKKNENVWLKQLRLYVCTQNSPRNCWIRKIRNSKPSSRWNPAEKISSVS